MGQQARAVVLTVKWQQNANSNTAMPFTEVNEHQSTQRGNT